MAYNDRRHQTSILDSFTLSPLPYPVILILAMVLCFLAISCFFTFGDFIEAAEEKISLVLLAVPLLLILLIRWLSSIESFHGLVGLYHNNRHLLMNYDQLNEGGSSPWGVAALVVLILIMAFFHSTFQNMWRL
ncbi:hypothetical protein FCM35_KLT07205 [Carex littledalei]|uniref:Uncharacterized protein n=1 Tax=Carex littledalei TaxID=544730 RepID=A0A833V743_9POAL|nr:hypothetical protein FCM35_KLT07205 [Carex littledalei]